VRVKTRHFLLQPLRHFYWRWIQLGGWRGGWHTLRLSILMSYFELEKYRILANVNQQC
jgi:(heptosyl)LPS beta-1,4-glucosyltransferase